MKKLATEFLQPAFSTEYKNALLGDEINNKVNSENHGDNDRLEVEEDVIVPSNDKEDVN